MGSNQPEKMLVRKHCMLSNFNNATQQAMKISGETASSEDLLEIPPTRWGEPEKRNKQQMGDFLIFFFVFNLSSVVMSIHHREKPQRGSNDSAHPQITLFAQIAGEASQSTRQ